MLTDHLDLSRRGSQNDLEIQLFEKVHHHLILQVNVNSIKIHYMIQFFL